MNLMNTLKKVFNFAKEKGSEALDNHREKLEEFSTYSDEQLLEMVDGKTNSKAMYASRELKNRGFTDEILKVMMKKNKE